MSAQRSGIKAAEAVKGKSGKISKINDLARRIASNPTEETTTRYAHNLIDPRGCEAVVMPSPTPTRSGVAKFPLIVEVTDPTDFGVVIQPDFWDPLRIYQGTAAAESGDTLRGGWTQMDFSLAQPQDLAYTSSGQSTCSVSAQDLAGRICLPLISSSGATLQINIAVKEISSVVSRTVRVYAYDAVASIWVTLGTTGPLVVTGDVFSLSGIAWSPDYSHITFGVVENYSSVSTYNFTIVPTVGTVTCAPLGAPTSAVIHSPDWSAMLEASTRARIVGCDCLVTFEGSTLNNGGSIAVCNTDDELPIKSSFYETIASQPFDMYRGRLASVGESEGGAHWHYVPDDPSAFQMTDLVGAADERRPVPQGYFGIKGKFAGEVVRIECHFIVNFYSSDPSYNMEVCPSFAEFARFLWAVRDLVPLVSSNDSHLKKLKRLGKSAGRKLVQAGQFGADHQAEISQALGLIATLL